MEGIAGFAAVGHGSPPFATGAQAIAVEFSGPNQHAYSDIAKPPYHLELVAIYSCYSADVALMPGHNRSGIGKGWISHVSQMGRFILLLGARPFFDLDIIDNEK